jgi:hypothetical protein
MLKHKIYDLFLTFVVLGPECHQTGDHPGPMSCIFDAQIFNIRLGETQKFLKKEKI